MSFTWSSPTRVVFGEGSLARLPALVEEVAGPGARIFLVTGRASLQASGRRSAVLEALGVARVAVFDDVPPFPSPDVPDRAAAALRASRAEVVVAIGGGSAMDVAKSAALLATHDGTAREYGERRREFARAGLPVIAAPTTSGSSSEVTPFAALWDAEAKRSLQLATPRLFPVVALVDPELALGMGRELAAVTGVDAFTSAFESYWSREAGPLSDALCLEVIRLYATHLERSCLVADRAARAACALAATVSGMAYSNSRPNVCHAVSSPLTLFWGVAHGQAVGITLPAFLRWNAPAIALKLPTLWHALGVDGLDAATTRITELMARCGLATRLGGLGVGAGDVETLVEHMRWDRTTVLPRPLGRDDARAIFRALL
ncbi:MAG: iron-containing alcohol dehydrogenase [Candidatus Rokubacteria bacterium]|nr:iron-containing alcohol dehydrogenase [Candidatus Rokubacteria bacterium]